MACAKGGSYCENRSSHKIWSTQLKLNGLNFCRKYMEQAWQSIDNSVIERLSIENNTKQEQYQALECSAPAMNLQK